MKHANYEIVLIEENIIFISNLSQGIDVFKDLTFVYDEIKRNFPNKRIICRDGRNKPIKWFEIVPLPKKYYASVTLEEYLDKTPTEDTITDCPNSIFVMREEEKIIFNDYESLKNNTRKYFNDFKK